MFDIKILDEKIFQFINVLNNTDELIRLIEMDDKNITDEDCIGKWIDWSTSDGYQFGFRKEINPNKLNTSSDNSYKIFNLLNDTISKCIENYMSISGNNIGLRTPFGISKYNVGSEMGKHVDDYEDYDKNPTVSGILYLNDNYQGGELYFEDQGIKIKPTAGSMVIFPSIKPYFHQSLKIIDGIKYMCPVFCYVDKVI